MAITYDITLTNGLSLAGVPELAINNTATSISLYGRGVAEYGEGLQNNLVHILENFANSSPPPNPLTGQFWFDSLDGIVKYFNGSAWIGLGTPGAGVITDAMISIAANIAIEKLERGSAEQIIVLDAAGVPRYQALSGDISILSTGEVSIIKDSKIALSGALRGSAIMVGLGDVDITVTIASLSVTASSLANNSVTLAKMADDSVGSNELIAQSVTSQALADNSVTESKLDNGAVTAVKLASESVSGAKIQYGTIQEFHLVDDSVTNDKIAIAAVNTDQIAGNAIKRFHIAEGAINTEKLNDGAVLNSKLANDSVSSDKLQADSIDSRELKTASVKSYHIGLAAVQESNIDDGSVSETKVKDGAITGPKLSDGSVDVNKIAHNGTAGADRFLKFNGSTLEFVEFEGAIPEGYITGDLIALGTITELNLATYVLSEDYGSISGGGFSNEAAVQDLSGGLDVIVDLGLIEATPIHDPLFETPDYGFLDLTGINILDLGDISIIASTFSDYGTL